jgi:hypothetical protein
MMVMAMASQTIATTKLHWFDKTAIVCICIDGALG